MLTVVSRRDYIHLEVLKDTPIGARLFLVSRNVVKHGLSCLTYYLLAPHAINQSRLLG